MTPKEIEEFRYIYYKIREWKKKLRMANKCIRLHTRRNVDGSHTKQLELWQMRAERAIKAIDAYLGGKKYWQWKEYDEKISILVNRQKDLQKRLNRTNHLLNRIPLWADYDMIAQVQKHEKHKMENQKIYTVRFKRKLRLEALQVKPEKYAKCIDVSLKTEEGVKSGYKLLRSWGKSVRVAYMEGDKIKVIKVPKKDITVDYEPQN